MRDHCQLTGKYRGGSHSKCNINVTEKQSIFIRFTFRNFSNYDCHPFCNTLTDWRKDEVKIYNIPKTNEDYNSVTYGFTRCIDSYRFSSMGLDELVRRLDNYGFEILKRKLPDKFECE